MESHAERTRELEESTAQYKSLVDNSPDSILMVQHAKVRFVNQAFLETFGLTGDDVAAGRKEDGPLLQGDAPQRGPPLWAKHGNALA